MVYLYCNVNYLDCALLTCQKLCTFKLSQMKKKKKQQNKSTSPTYHQIKLSNINVRFVFALCLILSKHIREKTMFPSFH